MKNLSIKFFSAIFFCSVALMSCDKDTTTTNPPGGTPAGCPDGNVCLKLNGTDISKPGGGYYFADTFTFVKYEEGAVQLSIDVFGSTAQSYTVGDVRQAGKGRIYYFPDNNNMYMSHSGSLTVTELTTDKKMTGTFSAKLYKYDSNNNTFNFADSMEITNGSFTRIQLSQ